MDALTHCFTLIDAFMRRQDDDGFLVVEQKLFVFVLQQSERARGEGEFISINQKIRDLAQGQTVCFASPLCPSLTPVLLPKPSPQGGGTSQNPKP